MKRQVVLFLILTAALSGNGFAYMEDYPPYSFKEEKPGAVEMKELIQTDFGAGEYSSEDGRAVIRLFDPDYGNSFKLEVETKVLLEVADHVYWPHLFYETDLNGDGLNDFVLFSWSRGVGLAVHSGEVHIFLKKPDGGYATIRYESFEAGPDDFIDMNNDGVSEVIVGSFYFGDGRNYFVYSIYEIVGERLVRADSKYENFPKFIRFTHKPNDQHAKDLTDEEKAKHILKIESQIVHG